VFAEKGEKFEFDELYKKVLKNKQYWTGYGESASNKANCNKGGVTLSGGDPLFQVDFVTAFCKSLKEENVHIALDTSLFIKSKKLDQLLPYVDLWMVSLKHMDADKHRELTGVKNELILKNLLYLDKRIDRESSGIRIRFLVIPGWTDSRSHIEKVCGFINKLRNLEKVEILPYGAHGKYKWIETCGSYPFEGVKEASKEDVKKCAEIFESHEFEVKTVV